MAEEVASVKECTLGHLTELFGDVDIYGWKAVREYHATSGSISLLRCHQSGVQGIEEVGPLPPQLH